MLPCCKPVGHFMAQKIMARRKRRRREKGEEREEGEKKRKGRARRSMRIIPLFKFIMNYYLNIFKWGKCWLKDTHQPQTFESRISNGFFCVWLN